MRRNNLSHRLLLLSTACGWCFAACESEEAGVRSGPNSGSRPESGVVATCALPMPDTNGWARIQARFAPMSLSLPTPRPVRGPEQSGREAWNTGLFVVSYRLDDPASMRQPRAELPVTECQGSVGGKQARVGAQYVADADPPRQLVYAIWELSNARSLELMVQSRDSTNKPLMLGVLRTVRITD
jgi:hypothetical protein